MHSWAGGPLDYDFARWVHCARGLYRTVASGRPMASKGAIRLISVKGVPTGDRILIGALNTSKEFSFLQEAWYVYRENSLWRLHIVGQNLFSWSRGPRRCTEPFRRLKAAFNWFVGP